LRTALSIAVHSIAFADQGQAGWIPCLTPTSPTTFDTWSSFRPIVSSPPNSLPQGDPEERSATTKRWSLFECDDTEI
jgi:hypothetical protein